LKLVELQKADQPKLPGREGWVAYKVYELIYFGIQDPATNNLYRVVTGLGPYQLWQFGTYFGYQISGSPIEYDIFIVVFGVHDADRAIRAVCN
jgi:hypothetical protein